MASFTFDVVADCDFAGIPLRKGMVILVRPGHVTRPITVQQDLPPNYGMLLNLMADETISSRDAFASFREQVPAGPPPRPLRRRRHLQLVR
jgi:hypothetical protein